MGRNTGSGCAQEPWEGVEDDRPMSCNGCGPSEGRAEWPTSECAAWRAVRAKLCAAALVHHWPMKSHANPQRDHSFDHPRTSQAALQHINTVSRSKLGAP